MAPLFSQRLLSAAPSSSSSEGVKDDGFDGGIDSASCSLDLLLLERRRKALFMDTRIPVLLFRCFTDLPALLLTTPFSCRIRSFTCCSTGLSAYINSGDFTAALLDVSTKEFKYFLEVCFFPIFLLAVEWAFPRAMMLPSFG